MSLIALTRTTPSSMLTVPALRRAHVTRTVDIAAHTDIGTQIDPHAQR